MANQNLSQFGEKLFVADADHTFIWDSAVSISKRVSRNSWLNSGTLTSDAPVTISQTWNNAAVAFTGLKMNAVSTASADASLLLDLQLGGVTQVNSTKAGSLFAKIFVSGGSQTSRAIEVAASGIAMGSLGVLAFAPASSYASNSDLFNVADTFLRRDGAANTLALRNGAAAQTFNVYGTWTTAITNFERLAIKYNTTDVAYQIAAEKGTTNGDYRPLQLWTGGASRLHVTTAGNVGIGTTSPTSKLHVAGSSSPSITVDNTLATGASQLLFKNTVVTGDTDGIFLNGSTQTGFGGAGSLNIKATTGPLAFHTASVTNALSIAQSGAITYTNSVLSASGSSGTFGTVGNENTYINQNSLRIFGFTSGLFLLGSAFSNANPALKRNGTSLDIVLADNTGFTSVQDLYRRFGAGTPEGVVTAPIGAVYHNTTGGAGTSFYVKESGTGNTGWVGK